MNISQLKIVVVVTEKEDHARISAQFPKEIAEGRVIIFNGIGVFDHKQRHKKYQADILLVDYINRTGARGGYKVWKEFWRKRALVALRRKIAKVVVVLFEQKAGYVSAFIQVPWQPGDGKIGVEGRNILAAKLYDRDGKEITQTELQQYLGNPKHLHAVIDYRALLEKI